MATQRLIAAAVLTMIMTVLTGHERAKAQPCGFVFTPLPAAADDNPAIPMPLLLEPSMAAVGGTVVLFGGFGVSFGSIQAFSHLWTYSTASGWQYRNADVQIGGGYPSVRNGAAATNVGPWVFIYGGENVFGGYGPNETLYGYSPADNFMDRFGTGPWPRHLPALCRQPGSADSLLMFGGRATFNAVGVTTQYGDTWMTSWRYTNWVRLATGGPSPRYGHTMVYDPVRNRAVLFGGRTTSGQYFGDTWEWDGASWQQRAIPGPSARANHMATWDPRSGRIILYGGWDGATMFADVWAYDGSTWTQLPQIGGPPIPARRSGGLAAFETPGTGNILMWAGFQAGVDVTNTGGLIEIAREMNPWVSLPCARVGDADILLQAVVVDASRVQSVQWFKDGVAIDPALNPTAATLSFVLPGPITLSDAGAYSVSVTSACGVEVSSPSTMNVREPLTLTRLPSDTVVCGTATIDVESSDQSRTSVIWEYEDATNGWMSITAFSTITDPVRGGSLFIEEVSTTQFRVFSGLGLVGIRVRAVIYDSCDGGQSGPILVTSPFLVSANPIEAMMDTGVVAVSGSGTACRTGSRTFSVDTTGISPGAEYIWRVFPFDGVSVGQTLTSTPTPLECGGGSLASVTPSNGPVVTVSIRPCLPGPRVYLISCEVRSVCGTYISMGDPPTINSMNIYEVCVADFDCSGTVEIDDIFAFLNAWFDGADVADVTGNGLSFDDIFAFLNAWFAGC